jgi:hypothetical protein
MRIYASLAQRPKDFCRDWGVRRGDKLKIFQFRPGKFGVQDFHSIPTASACHILPAKVKGATHFIKFQNASHLKSLNCCVLQHRQG